MYFEQKERTLSIIKPDAVAKGVIGSIIHRFEISGLSIVEVKMLRLTTTQAVQFYKEHQDKSFFNNLIQFIISNVVFIQILEGKDAVRKQREIIGDTDPMNALAGTIRSDYGTSRTKNAIHGSDSEKSAKREIFLFFNV